MTTCADFYSKWEDIGNYCNKSEMTAKQIDKYIEYRKKYGIESYEINRCALWPFIMIENKEVLHTRCLKKLKNIARRRGGRNITRRMSVEIINEVNNEIEPGYRITFIPEVRSKMDGFQHTVEGISYETKDLFNEIKKKSGFKNNDNFLNELLRSYSGNTEENINTEENVDNIEPVVELVRNG